MISFLLSLLLAYLLSGLAITIAMVLAEFEVTQPRATVFERTLLAWSVPWASAFVLIEDGYDHAAYFVRVVFRAVLTGDTVLDD